MSDVAPSAHEIHPLIVDEVWTNLVDVLQWTDQDDRDMAQFVLGNLWRGIFAAGVTDEVLVRPFVWVHGNARSTVTFGNATYATAHKAAVGFALDYLFNVRPPGVWLDVNDHSIEPHRVTADWPRFVRKTTTWRQVPGHAEALRDLGALLEYEYAMLGRGTQPNAATATKPIVRRDDELLTVQEIRELVPNDVSSDAIDAKLRRFRETRDFDWEEIANTKPREPKYLYRWGAVKHLFDLTGPTVE